MSKIYPLFLILLLRAVMAIDGHQEADNARNITFLAPVSDFHLVGHVIANRTVDTPDQCQIECFFIAECTSLNFDTSPRASPNCQLSASNKKIKLGDLTPKPGYIYQGSKNDCFGNPCNSSNHTCQSGFGPRGFRCICANCLTGSYCDKYTSDTVLNFPTQSTDQDTVKYVEFPDLVNFTISLWLQMNLFSGTRTAFSFEGKVDGGNVDEIALIFYRDSIRIDFQGDGLSQRYDNQNKIFDGNWHHIALTWSLSFKAINIYIDGNSIKEKKDNTHKQLKRNLRFTLGQEQDSYDNGNYENMQSFVGNITAFNMWDRVFADNEISLLAKECPSSHRQGNLLNWPDIVQDKNDALKYFCGLSCEDFGLVNQDHRNQEKTTHACFDNQ
ncbi:sushi, von Willebrand factor type A, EGF and pentraxin domain-containing protein 1-like isoform X2 [Exaiptasia diaphana]|uniref:Uncharacterized protein n=1 Tax=Exaiptasia diaphana TaxID=2652724 RepID=A0A913YZ34_EXADI|nr:sushi, von Willebrand factor type A, EGF and pentraxin domain-containing protein 1-like isoform X2 [Exaiptasia diaphana]